ncbi:low-affinity phosphate transporter [Physocladia obscura]|uniref:Low-affinity phosphate transporter n=1 Tax=Physocladia obscura TaxID=109957 RepID=A0AAD5SYN5_9FUNG|nr:low-affinity phosphate transporter [Physocladia obscura]
MLVTGLLLATLADYIAYDSLKKWLYLVEKAKLGFIELPNSYRDVDPDVFIKFGNRNYNSPRLTPVSNPFRGTSNLNERTPLLADIPDVSSNSPKPSKKNKRPLRDAPGPSSSESELPSPTNAEAMEAVAPSRRSHLENFFIEPLDDQLHKIVRFYSAKKEELVQKIEDLTLNIGLVEGFDRPSNSTLNAPLINAPSYIENSGPSYNQRSGRSSPSDLQSPVSDNSRISNLHVATRKVSQQSMSASFSSDGGSSSWAVQSITANSHPATFPNTLGYNFWNRSANKIQRANFRSQSATLYSELKELQEYVLMNHNGFAKILKKYEKVTGFRLKARYMQVVDGTYVFRSEEAAGLRDAIDRVVEIYARVAADNDFRNAKIELDSKCRQRINIERNTVWKDMVEAGGRTMSIVEARRKPDDENGNHSWYSKLFTLRFIVLLILLCVFYTLLNYQLFDTVEQQNCFAIFVFASGMWAFEIVPLFVTSAMVPFLVVVLQVMREAITLPDGTTGHRRLDAKGQAKRVFAEMFSPVIMLLLGGFSLGSAVSKHGIAKLLASFVLDKAGREPKSPILRNIPTSSSYARALIMGIALAANVGGMASPIASPQNIIAMGIMNPTASWFEWFAIAIPVCIVIDLCIWVILLAIYQPKVETQQNQQQSTIENGLSNGNLTNTFEVQGTEVLPHINQYMTQEPLTWTQWYILAITFSTIVLWCVENEIEKVVGDMGVTALLPIIAFYGTGILSKDDWNQQLWNVVMLAMGGICLGKAVDSSGLLAHITSLITPHLNGLSAYMCMLVFSLIVLVITSFVSHTVGALIILPVVAEIGAKMPDPQPRMLIILIALVCSGAMGLPVSSFPNMNAISQQDSVGVPYISVVDFHKVGLLSSVLAWGTIRVRNILKNNMSLQAGQLYCYRCSDHMSTCKCAGRKGKTRGEDMQLMIDETQLPGPELPAVANASAWAELVATHILAGKFRASAFVRDMASRGLFDALSSERGRIRRLWNTYKATPAFAGVAPRLNNLWTVQQMTAMGDEALESLFAGRWWELQSVSIVFIMNAFETSAIDPKAPENQKLGLICDAIKAIVAVIVQTSKLPGFTIVAPSSTSRMKKLTVFVPIMDFD